MVLKLGNLILSHEKSYMTTVDDVPERFPVKIAFTRKLTDDEMMRLAVYAALVEKEFSIESRRGNRHDETMHGG